MPMGNAQNGWIDKERWEAEAKRTMPDGTTGRLVMFRVLRKEDPVDLSGGTYDQLAEPVVCDIVFFPVLDPKTGEEIEPAEVFRSERVIGRGMTNTLRKARVNLDVASQLVWFTEGKKRPHVRANPVPAGAALDWIAKSYDDQDGWNEDPYSFFERVDATSGGADDDEIPF